MEARRYVLLVISREPIDLGEIRIEEQEGVEHFVREQLIIKSGIGGDLVTEKALPEQNRMAGGYPYRGYGNSASVVITSFLHDLCSALAYIPWRDRRKKPDGQYLENVRKSIPDGQASPL